MNYRGLILGIVLTLLLVLPVSGVHAWYGAGTTTGWEPTHNGLTGQITNTLSIPPASYPAGSTVPITLRLSSSPDGAAVSGLPLYLKIFRVTHSPLTQNLGDSSAATTVSLSENTLYQNNQNGDDAQILYYTARVGTISLNPGMTQTITTSALIGEPGYYQYDLTDQSETDSYAPGHIYAAGFLRIVQAVASPTPTSGSSTSSSGTSSSSSSTSGSGPTPTPGPTLIPTTTPLPSFLLTGDTVDTLGVDTEGTPSPEIPNALLSGDGDVEGISTNTQCSTCRYAFFLFATGIILQAGYWFIVHKSGIDLLSKKTWGVSIVMALLTHVIFVVLNWTCIQPMTFWSLVTFPFGSFLCRYFLFLTLAGAVAMGCAKIVYQKRS